MKKKEKVKWIFRLYLQQDFISIGKKGQRKVFKGKITITGWRERLDRKPIEERLTMTVDNEIEKRETDQERSDVPWSLRELILLLRVTMP